MTLNKLKMNGGRPGASTTLYQMAMAKKENEKSALGRIWGAMRRKTGRMTYPGGGSRKSLIRHNKRKENRKSKKSKKLARRMPKTN